jgi:DNA polymerase V
MQKGKPVNIPVVSAAAEQPAASGSNCEEKQTVALMVLGDSMAPEFVEGEILVIEMKAPAGDGAFVVAEVPVEGFIFRQLVSDEQGGWRLHALNPAYPDIALPGLDAIKGLVTQKKKAGERKAVKHYGAGV